MDEEGACDIHISDSAAPHMPYVPVHVLLRYAGWIGYERDYTRYVILDHPHRRIDDTVRIT